jgi:hypothetical protein
MAALCQVDDDEAGESQPDIGMDGISNVEKLEGPKCGREEGQKANVREPARSDAPRGPRGSRSIA